MAGILGGGEASTLRSDGCTRTRGAVAARLWAHPWKATFIRARRVARAVTVKAKVGRTRYVAFRVEGGPVSRQNLGAALPASARLTRFDGVHGIARTTHRDLDGLRQVLNGPRRVGARDVHLVSLATSGTIRAAARALPAESAASKPSRRKQD